MQLWCFRFSESMVSSCGVGGLASHYLFVSNWQSAPTCLGYLWYLSLDMQLHLFATLFFCCIELSPFVGVFLAVLTTVISCILRAINCRAYNICNNSDVDIPVILSSSD